MNNSGKKLLVFAVWIVIALFGLYMTFFSPNNEEEYTENIFSEEMQSNEENKMIFDEAVNYEAEGLPMEENITDDESYYEGIEPSVYFTNTEVIDAGNLPLEVHAVLVTSSQTFLDRSGYEDVTELYIDEESYVEDEKHIAFNCFLDGHTQQLRIVYEIEETTLKFSIIE